MRAAALAVAALLVLSLTRAAVAAPDVKLVLDFALQGQQSPFLLAADTGLFEQAGVVVQVDRGYGSGDAIAKVASGAYDMGFADLGALIQFNAKQGAVKAISVFQVYDVAPMCVFVLERSGIGSPQGLAGRRIAAPAGSASRVMFPLLAKASGLALDSVTWVDVTAQLRETLLARGQVDAAVALISDLPGVRRMAGAEPVTVMPYRDFGVDIYGHAIVTTPEFAARHPDRIRRALAGATAAFKIVIGDPARGIAALKKRDALVDEAMERERLDFIIRDAIVTDHVRRQGLSAVDPERLRRTIATVADSFNVPAVDSAALYRADYLPPAADRILGSR